MTLGKPVAPMNSTIGDAAVSLLNAMQSDVEGDVAVTSPENADATRKSKVIDTEEQDAKVALAAAELAAVRAGRPLPPPLRPTWKTVPQPENFTASEIDAIEALLKMRYPPVPRPAISPLTPPANKQGDKGAEGFPFPVMKKTRDDAKEKEVLSAYTELEVDAIVGLVKLSTQTADHPESNR
ncbi:hypothetical protein PRZ48_009041 [Zasmidium cellare]|uniref:Uncharacterized protein n=1 Tax=Zasmidium cellare TaxID=395010 RepID=A0ABR0EHK7_ZASCE|nr:hypothetical protein PRZ48_009041 [Zasmidium cellare]